MVSIRLVEVIDETTYCIVQSQSAVSSNYIQPVSGSIQDLDSFARYITIFLHESFGQNTLYLYLNTVSSQHCCGRNVGESRTNLLMMKSIAVLKIKEE